MGVTSVDIWFHSSTVLFYLFLPQTCHNGMAKAFLLSPNARHQALPEAAEKFERALGSWL